MKHLSLAVLIVYSFLSTASVFAQDLRVQQSEESRKSSLITQPSTNTSVTPVKPESSSSLRKQHERSSDLKKESRDSRLGTSSTRGELKPDLVPLQLILSKDTVSSGESLIFQVMVQNNGSDSLDDISLVFLIDGRQVGSKNIDLAAHATKSVAFRHVARKIGKHTFLVRLDPENSLDERNERNNEKASHFTVVRKEAVAIQSKQQPTSSISKVDTSGALRPLKYEQGNKPLVPQGGGGFDLSCSLPLQQGVHVVDPKNPFILVKVQNNGVQNPAAFYVGLGKTGSAKIGNGATWLNLYQVVAGGVPSGKFIYVHLKLPPGVDEKTDLVVGVDSNGEIQEKDETNNLTSSFRIQYKGQNQPSLPPKTADLVVFPETKDGIYYGDGKGVSVKVNNIGTSDAPPCTIGIGFSDQVEKGGKIKWAGKATVPKIFSGQHVYVTVPGQFQVLPTDSVYTVAVDINNDINEQGGENNNLSKSFSYTILPGKQFNLLPMGTPFIAFDIKQPLNGENFVVGSDQKIAWYPTPELNNLSPEEKSKYWEIDMSLVDPATNKVVAVLAKNVNNRPVNGYHVWRVTLPDNVGDYRIRLSSRQGVGWGQSETFSLYKSVIAQVDSSVLAKGTNLLDIASKMEKKNLSKAEIDVNALNFKHMRIKSITPKTVVLNGGLGPYARLTSISVVVEYESNKPFRLTSSLKPPQNLKPDAVWSLAVPTVSVKGCLVGSNEVSYIGTSYGLNDCLEVDPVTGQYPWETHFKIGSGPKLIKYPQGILPKGKNTFTLEMDEAGVAHGLEIIGKAEKMVDYKKGVIIKHKWVYAKCSRKFYPYFNVAINLQTYRGANDPEWKKDLKAYGFKVPPVWQRLDPWEKEYFDKNQVATGVPAYSASNCTFE